MPLGEIGRPATPRLGSPRITTGRRSRMVLSVVCPWFLTQCQGPLLAGMRPLPTDIAPHVGWKQVDHRIGRGQIIDHESQRGGEAVKQLLQPRPRAALMAITVMVARKHPQCFFCSGVPNCQSPEQAVSWEY
jgi:hypothetical protein